VTCHAATSRRGGNTEKRHWKHGALRTSWKKQYRISCKCGAHSPIFGSENAQAAEAWYIQHTGLTEKQEKIR
jgi:hypothetical protein